MNKGPELDIHSWTDDAINNTSSKSDIFENNKQFVVIIVTCIINTFKARLFEQYETKTKPLKLGTK